MRTEIYQPEPKRVWIAFDGAIFDSANECECHEADFVRNIPHVIENQETLFDGSPFCLYVFFKIENELQLELFEAWCRSKFYEGDEPNIDFRRFLGKTVIVDCRNESSDELEGISDIYAIETIEERIGEYAAALFNAIVGLN